MDIETGNTDLGPVFANALQFILDLFKSGPHKIAAQQHSDAIAAAIQNIQTNPNDPLPGDLATAQQTGESEGQQYSLIFCSSPSDFESKILDFERTVSGVFEIIGIRIPQFSQIMGSPNNQVVGTLFGGDDAEQGLKDIVQSLNAAFLSAVPVQFKVERLTDPNRGQRSGWLSIDQVHAF